MRNIALATVMAATGLVGVTAAPASAAYSCPSSGWACFYIDNNFNNLAADVKAGSSITWTSSNTIWNQASSVRNRTGCTLYMRSGQGHTISLGPNREVASLGATYGSFWNDQIESVYWVGC